jgi:Holliday junction resolvasome RuvABC endonuclease subunit
MAYRVLAIDPSIACTGWAVVCVGGEDENIVDAGAIATKPTAKKLKIRVMDDDAQRCLALVSALDRVASERRVDLLCSELSSGSQSARSSHTLGIVKGAMVALAACRRLRAEWVHPFDVKRACSGGRHANVSKEQIEAGVRRRFGDSIDRFIGKASKASREAICDALGVYMAGVLVCPWLRREDSVEQGDLPFE